MKIAVVTPYFKEDRFLIERCINSVKNQTVNCEHFLVSDGIPQEWINDSGVRHIKLDRNYDDYGNTPRGIGSQLAISENCEAIALLDADNWFDADHIETCLRAASRRTGDPFDCDYVIARRRFIKPDGDILPHPEERNHVDTNCLFYLKGALHMLPYWNLMPRHLAGICDRVIYWNLRGRKLKFDVTDKVTVNYLTLWESMYLTLNHDVPENAKPNIDVASIINWYKSLSDREKFFVFKTTGLKNLSAK